MPLRSALALLLAALPAAALIPAYRAERLSELQGAGRVVLVYFTSQTCTLCRQQEETLERLQQGGSKSAPAILQADFDSDAELRRTWGVTTPGTLVLLRGPAVVDKSTGLVSEDDIRQFVRDGVSRSRGRPKARAPRPVRPKR
ncbi:thioredoxin [bacterium]|nr:MAG: thioredoxin [bacterium]